MSLPLILVTGSNGQLGKELQQLAPGYPGYRFVFLSRSDLPIHHFDLVRNFFASYKPDFCINCAAYTSVDEAESEQDLAFLVNAEAVGVLAAVCREYNCRFIHISTDYVFDGNSPVPYRETDPVQPVNTYGRSKWEGEQLAFRYDPAAVVIRTSWVYSEFGHNFVKTMLRLMKERQELNVVSDQVGAPTYAADLAQAILKVVETIPWQPGIYHYSNSGSISWYEFAMAIKELSHSPCTIQPIPTSQYPTPAKRPRFSLLDTLKIRTTYNLSIPQWKNSLKTCLGQLGAIPE